MKISLSRFTLALIFILSTSVPLLSQYSEIEPDGPGYGENCTTIMVGRLASTDGSVMTSHTCDGNYRTWLEIYPHQKHEKGEMHPVWKGMLHTEVKGDMTNVTKA